MLIETSDQTTHALTGYATCGRCGLREWQALVDGAQRFHSCDQNRRWLLASCELFEAGLLLCGGCPHGVCLEFGHP